MNAIFSYNIFSAATTNNAVGRVELKTLQKVFRKDLETVERQKKHESMRSRFTRHSMRKSHNINRDTVKQTVKHDLFGRLTVPLSNKP